MTELNFPSSPSTNDTYMSGGTTWKWDGTKWSRVKDVVMSSTYPGVFMETGTTSISTSNNYVDLDNKVLDPDDNYSLSSGIIEVSTGGYFSIQYSIPVDDVSTLGALRGGVQGFVERDQANTTWIEISQSRSQDYAREGSRGEGISSGFIVQLEDNEKIRLGVIINDAVDVATVNGKTQLSIHRIG